ncbi:MAG: hypothetical protein ACK5DE_03835 [Bacteroidota bacterium]|jgi:hypothetical protein
MAIATSAILAGVSIAATAASTGMSFAQAGKQKRAMKQAERDAEEAMQEARKKLEINVYEKLAIQKEPYELEREALLSQGAQAIQAGVESERGAAATAGRIQMAQQEGQAGVRTAMGQEMAGLERLTAQEEGRLRDIGVQLDLEEVAGAQLAAANAAELSAQAMQQGMEGVVSLGSQVASLAPLYQKSAAVKQFNAAEQLAQKAGMTPEQLQADIGMMGTVDGIDFSKVSGMNRSQYQDFMSKIDPKIIRQIGAQQVGLFTQRKGLTQFSPKYMLGEDLLFNPPLVK